MIGKPISVVLLDPVWLWQRHCDITTLNKRIICRRKFIVFKSFSQIKYYLTLHWYYVRVWQLRRRETFWTFFCFEYFDQDVYSSMCTFEVGSTVTVSLSDAKQKNFCHISFLLLYRRKTFPSDTQYLLPVYKQRHEYMAIHKTGNTLGTSEQQLCPKWVVQTGGTLLCNAIY